MQTTHAVARVELVDGLAVPAAQFMQDDCCVLGWYVPVGHGVHAPDPAAE